MIQGKTVNQFSPEFTDSRVRDMIAGSPGRTRTSDRVVTSTPYVSIRLGLSHSRKSCSSFKGSGAIEAYWLGSSPHSLCTFPPTFIPSADFAQGYHILRQAQDLGFPEFTRFFNPDFSGKLHFEHESRDDNWHTVKYTYLTLP